MAIHLSIQFVVTDLSVRVFDLVLVMDEVHCPSYFVDTNLLWIEEPCEQQQVHEIASILQKNRCETEYSMIFISIQAAYAIEGTCLSPGETE